MNRLKELRIEKGVLQSDIAKIINKGERTVGFYESGDRDMGTETLAKLSDYFNVSIDYLLGKSDIRNNKSNDLSDKLFLVKVYGKISAGQPNWAEECLEGYLPIDPNLMHISSPDECFFLKVNGESMNKLVANGAYALIRKTDFVEDGEIAVVLVNGFDATLKKFTRQDNFILLEPMSNDPSFKAQIYDKNTTIKILGKYIGKFEING